MKVLEVAGVDFLIGGLKILDGVSFDVNAAEVVGIIGPNGAGKTSIMNVITGMAAPTAGQIRFEGARIDSLPAYKIANLGIRRTFQTSLLFPGLSVLENVMCALDKDAKYGIGDTLLQRARLVQTEGNLRDLAMEALVDVGMVHFSDRPGQDLSFGQQRLVELARALVCNPKLVMLDEPGVGLSPARMNDLQEMIKRIATRRGIAILLIEHVIHLVLDVCNRLVVMNAGKVIAQGDPHLVTQEPTVIQSYLGRGYYAQS